MVCKHRNASFTLDVDSVPIHIGVCRTTGSLFPDRIYPTRRILSDSVSCPHSRLWSRWSGSSRFLRIGDLRGFRRSPQLSYTPTRDGTTSKCVGFVYVEPVKIALVYYRGHQGGSASRKEEWRRKIRYLVSRGCLWNRSKSSAADSNAYIVSLVLGRCDGRCHGIPNI
jgi:hypothetical protein